MAARSSIMRVTRDLMYPSTGRNFAQDGTCACWLNDTMVRSVLMGMRSQAPFTSAMAPCGVLNSIRLPVPWDITRL